MIQTIAHVVMRARPLLDHIGVGVGVVVGRSACLTGHAYHKRVLHAMYRLCKDCHHHVWSPHLKRGGSVPHGIVYSTEL